MGTFFFSNTCPPWCVPHIHRLLFLLLLFRLLLLLLHVTHTGRYNGKMDCEETVQQMKDCLKRCKLYPFSPSL